MLRQEQRTGYVSSALWSQDHTWKFKSEINMSSSSPWISLHGFAIISSSDDILVYNELYP